MDRPYQIDLPKIKSKSGFLSYLDEDTHLPISIKHLYWVYDADQGAERGNHAHINSDRVLVCLKGSLLVKLENVKGNKFEFELKEPSAAVFFPRMHWINLTFSKGAILLVASSCKFQEDVLLDDYTAFRNFGMQKILK